MDLKKREEFSSLESKTREIIELAESENRGLTAEEKAQTEQNFAQIESAIELDKSKKRLAGLKFDNGDVQLPTEPPGRSEIEVIERPQRFDAKNFDRQAFDSCGNHWMRTGQVPQRFATITTSTQSNLFFPSLVSKDFVAGSAVNAFRAGYQAWGLNPNQSTWVQTADSAQYKYPVLDANIGSALAETASSDSENVPTLTQSITSTPSAYQSGSKWFSNLELNSVSFDLMGAFLPTAHYEKELDLESTIAAAIVADAGVTQSVTCATGVSLTYTNLVNLNNKLPKKYWTFRVMFLSADAFAAAEGLTASTSGVPMLMQDAQNQNLKRFNGTPVIRSDYFESFGASKKVGAIVSLFGFHLRDAGPEYIEVYGPDKDRAGQKGFNVIGNHAYGYAVSAVAKLVTPSTW